jgi:hypothetical protein
MNIAYLYIVCSNMGVQTLFAIVRLQCHACWFWGNSLAHSVPMAFGQPEASAHCTGRPHFSGGVMFQACTLFPAQKRIAIQNTHGVDRPCVAVDDAERMSSQLTLVTAPRNACVVDRTKPLRRGPNVTSSKTVRIRQFIGGDRWTPSAACNSRQPKSLSST